MIERNWFWVAFFPSRFIPTWQTCRKALRQTYGHELWQVGGPFSHPCGPDLTTRNPKINSQHPVSPSAGEKVAKGRKDDRCCHWVACGDPFIPDKLEAIHPVVKSCVGSSGWRYSALGVVGSPAWPLTPVLPPGPFHAPPPHLLPLIHQWPISYLLFQPSQLSLIQTDFGELIQVFWPGHEESMTCAQGGNERWGALGTAACTGQTHRLLVGGLAKLAEFAGKKEGRQTFF